MAHKFVLDTHALVWHLEGNPRLGQSARRVIEDPLSGLVLPIVSLAEAAYIVEHGRTAIPSVSDLLRSISADFRISIQPMTWEVFKESLREGMPPEMHDRLILASALQLQSLGDTVSLLTKDASIVEAGLVTILW